MSDLETLHYQTMISLNPDKTIVSITITSKTRMNGQLVVDILSQIVDDYIDAPNSIIECVDELTIN